MGLPSVAAAMKGAGTVAVLFLMAATPLRADDSLAALGAGGLRLLTSEDVAMEHQDLVLSPDLVSVAFTFRNRSPTPVESLVAFVLPDLTPEDYRRRFPDAPPRGDNFLSFEGEVDGRAIVPQWEIRAIASDGADITDRLAAAGAGPSYFALDRQSDTRERLRRAGFVDEDGIPVWTMRTRLYWRQAFPVSRPVVVEHRYRPLVGEMALFVPMLEDSPVGHGLATDYCMSAADKAAALAMDTTVSNDDRMVVVRFIDYTLTTGANWKGPIGDLSVTVDAGAPDHLVATCFPGLRRVTPGRFEARARDVEPTEDIRLMIIGPR